MMRPSRRDRWFADSPLEGDGFEPSVPRPRRALLSGPTARCCEGQAAAKSALRFSPIFSARQAIPSSRGRTWFWWVSSDPTTPQKYTTPSETIMSDSFGFAHFCLRNSASNRLRIGRSRSSSGRLAPPLANTLRRSARLTMPTSFPSCTTGTRLIRLASVGVMSWAGASVDREVRVDRHAGAVAVPSRGGSA